MTAVVDGYGNTADVVVYMELCIRAGGKTEHHRFHKEYLDFLKAADIQDVSAYYNFTPEQIYAIALYL